MKQRGFLHALDGKLGNKNEIKKTLKLSNTKTISGLLNVEGLEYAWMLNRKRMVVKMIHVP